MSTSGRLILRRAFCQLQLLELPECAGAAHEPAGAEAGEPLPAGEAGIIWRAAEMPAPALASDEAARLSPESFARLKALGILRPGEPAGAVSCLVCELDHAEGVEAEVDADGRPRYFIKCPEAGRVEIPPDRLQRWRVDFTSAAQAIRDALKAAGPLEVVRPGRLWRLGRAGLAGRSRELWMLRESRGPRSDEGVVLVAGGADAALFVLGGRALAAKISGVRSDGILRMEDLMELTDRGFRLDAPAVTARLARRRMGPRPARKVNEGFSVGSLPEP